MFTGLRGKVTHKIPGNGQLTIGGQTVAQKLRLYEAGEAALAPEPFFPSGVS